MRNRVYLLAVLLLAACSTDPAERAVGNYLDALRPRFAPHKVTAVTRRDSAACPKVRLNRALELFEADRDELARRLDEMKAADRRGDRLTFMVARMAALDYLASRDPSATIGGLMSVGEESFAAIPKDCVAVACEYSRNGATPDKGVFYLSEDGTGVVFSDAELLHGMDPLLDVYDKIRSLEAAIMNYQ